LANTSEIHSRFIKIDWYRNLSVILIFLYAELHSLPAFSQIINIEAERIVSDTTGWFGDINGNFSFQQNVNTIYAFNAGIHAENKSKSTKDLWLFIGNAGLLKVNNERFANNALGLVLYDRKLNPVIRAEGLSIVSQNEITDIELRWQIGGGIRCKLAELSWLKIYAAAIYIYEHEESALADVPARNENRLSPYFTFTLLPVENLRIVSTTYYQPLLNDFSDYRLLNVEQLKIDITSKFSFTVDFSYQYDEFPQPDIPRNIAALSMGVKYKFRDASVQTKLK
jgi:Protein of unknown function, DUF481